MWGGGDMSVGMCVCVEGMCVCVEGGVYICVCVCVRARARVCVWARARVCVLEVRRNSGVEFEFVYQGRDTGGSVEVTAHTTYGSSLDHPICPAGDSGGGLIQGRRTSGLGVRCPCSRRTPGLGVRCPCSRRTPGLGLRCPCSRLLWAVMGLPLRFR